MRDPVVSGPVVRGPVVRGPDGDATGPVRNPVSRRSLPDPAVLRVGEQWWAFATNGSLGNVQVLRSPDLRRWEPVGDGMPVLPSWARKGWTWAPEVIVVGDRFVMYYTARVGGTGLQGVGCAVADRPEGPYRDENADPLVFVPEEGGSIDATPFVDDDGARYLWWKNDGNALGADTWLYAGRLSDDGCAVVGPTRRVMKQDQAWEGAVVEGPFLLRRAGVLHLFYSGNAFDSADYGVGHAICETPLGPCRKTGDGPILRTNDVAVGPGHCVVVEDAGRTWMVHHAYRPSDAGRWTQGRQMWLTEVTWVDGLPVCHGPRRGIDGGG